MSFETVFINLTSSVSQFWLNTADRLKEAKDAGKSYTADQFAAAAAGTAVDAINIWTSVYPDIPVPLVSTILVSDKAAAFKLGVSGVGGLTFDVPTTAAFTTTDLTALGGGSPIPTKAVTVAFAGSQVTITVKTSAAPALGTYQGLVFLNAPPPQPLIQIVAVAT